MKAIVHGTGLIGSSVGLALAVQGWEVAGWDPDPQALEMAERLGAVARSLDGPGDGLDQVDLVVLAGPPSATLDTLATLTTPALVTDVAGVKVPIVVAAGHLPHFVGGHPMAGRASSGPGSASASMFQGATWVLTEDGSNEADLDRMTSIVASMGADPTVMSAEEHDAAVAQISHVPHLLAASLLDLASDEPQTLGLAAGGFRDLTRVAASEPGWWSEVLLANSDHVVTAIEALEERLLSWKGALRAGRPDQVTGALERARTTRSGLGPGVTQVGVLLFDRPGEIARVGHALEQSRVDVRDLQLRHAEHGGGGILTLSVYPGEAARLRAALVGEGFSLEPG